MLNVSPSADDWFVSLVSLVFFALSAGTIMKSMISQVAPEAIARSRSASLVELERVQTGLNMKEMVESLEMPPLDVSALEESPLEASYESEYLEEEHCEVPISREPAHIRLRQILQMHCPGDKQPLWKLEEALFDADLDAKLADAVHGHEFTVPSDSDLLSYAVERGNWQALDCILTNGTMESTDPVHHAMHKAASLGMAKCMERLLAATVHTGVPAVVAGDALFTLAVKSGNAYLVVYLLQFPIFDPRYNNDEALMAAAGSKVKGNIRVLQALIQRVDPRVQSNGAMLAAIDADLPDLLRVLLDDPRVHPSCNRNEPMFRYLSKPDLDRDIFRQLYFNKDFDPARNDYAILRKLATNNIRHWKAPEVMAHPRANINTCITVLQQYSAPAAIYLLEAAETVTLEILYVDNAVAHANFYLNYHSWRNNHEKVRDFARKTGSLLQTQRNLRRSHRMLLLGLTGHWETMYELRHEIAMNTPTNQEYALSKAIENGFTPLVEFFWLQLRNHPEIGKFIDMYRRVEYNIHWMKCLDKQVEAMQASLKKLAKEHFAKMPVHRLMLQIALKHYTAMFTIASQMKQPLPNDVSDLIMKKTWSTYGSPLNHRNDLASVLAVLQ